MFGLFNSLTELTTDVVKVVAAPVEMAVDLVDAAVKPIAEVAEEFKEDVKLLKD